MVYISQKRLLIEYKFNVTCRYWIRKYMIKIFLIRSLYIYHGWDTRVSYFNFLYKVLQNQNMLISLFKLQNLVRLIIEIVLFVNLANLFMN